MRRNTSNRGAERGSAVRLVAFDLDGTIVRGSAINCGALIAQALGHPEWIEEMEPLYMRGLAPGEMQARLAPLLEYPLEQLCAPLLTAELAPGAREGFALLRERGLQTAIVSLAWDFVVEWFANQLGADHWIASRFERGQAAAPLWPEQKGARLLALARRLGLERSQLAAVGDSVRDETLLRASARPFYVGRDLPAELADVTHYPDGDLLRIARAIAHEAEPS